MVNKMTEVYSDKNIIEVYKTEGRGLWFKHIGIIHNFTQYDNPRLCVSRKNIEQLLKCGYCNGNIFCKIHSWYGQIPIFVLDDEYTNNDSRYEEIK